MLSRSIVSICAVAGALGLMLPAAAQAAPDYAPYGYGGSCAAPFDNPNNITSVKPFKVTKTNLKHSWQDVQGAVVTVAAQPGITREWLQRLVDDPNQAGPGCPLGVQGSRAAVSSTATGFAITVSARNKDAAQEILRRAESLKTTAQP